LSPKPLSVLLSGLAFQDTNLAIRVPPSFPIWEITPQKRKRPDALADSYARPASAGL